MDANYTYGHDCRLDNCNYNSSFTGRLQSPVGITGEKFSFRFSPSFEGKHKKYFFSKKRYYTRKVQDTEKLILSILSLVSVIKGKKFQLISE